MERALSLAARGKGRTSPNPMVGAVVVKQGLVVGEGYHLRAGSDHAEVMALREAKESAVDATLYVSLEPCCHYGRTPPCTERIIESRIRRVVASMLDPNPMVCGKGFARLKEAGLQVEWGLMEEESRRLNEAYVKWVTTGMPFVILKGAVSLDGKIATRTGESRWITGEKARQRAHELRSEVDAVMVGIGTILKDDPQLTTRLSSGEGKDPLRIILDTALRLPPGSKVLRTDSRAATLLVTSSLSPQEKLEGLRSRGVEVWTMEEEGGRIPLRPLLKRLGERQIMSVMIEGGSELNGAALEEGIADKVILFLSPRLIGGASAPSWIGGKGMERLEECWSLKNISLERVGDDIIIQGYLQPPEKTACSLG